MSVTHLDQFSALWLQQWTRCGWLYVKPRDGGILLLTSESGVFHHRDARRGKTWCKMSLAFVIRSEGDEEDDDAYQQDHQQHHRCQEEGSACRPACQLDQGLTQAASCGVIPRRRAGKPNVQRAVWALAPSSHTYRRSWQETGFYSSLPVVKNVILQPYLLTCSLPLLRRKRTL